MIRAYLRANKESEAAWQERRKEQGFRGKVFDMWTDPRWNLGARFSERLQEKMDQAAKENTVFDYSDAKMREEMIEEVAGEYIEAQRNRPDEGIGIAA